MSLYATDCYSSGTGVTSFFLYGASNTTPSSVSTVYKSGIITRDFTSGSGTTNIAHGLGTTPKKITFNSIYKFSNDTSTGQGVFDSGGNYNINYVFSPTNSYTPTISSVYAIDIETSSINAYQRGIVSVDETNIIINWTANDGGYNGNISIMYSAEG
jgi:glycogen debranching enzyme